MIDSRLTMLSMIHRHGTVTAAAHSLRYSPSTVSHQVKQLAAELGVTLLEQHGRNVRLTPAAEALLRHVDVMSAEWEMALADLGRFSETVSGSLGLCGFSTAASLLLPPTMRALNEQFPHMQTQTIEAEPSECFDFLLSGDADIGIVVAAPDIPAGGDDRFSHHFLIDDPLDLIFPSTTDWRTAHRSQSPKPSTRHGFWAGPAPDTTNSSWPAVRQPGSHPASGISPTTGTPELRSSTAASEFVWPHGCRGHRISIRCAGSPSAVTMPRHDISRP